MGFLVAAVWQACAVYEPSLLTSARLELPDAGAAEVDASPAPPSTCARARWPERPARDDDTLGAAPSAFVTALRSLELGRSATSGAATATGYDLDGVCTCPERDACLPAPGVSARCDGPGGRDNAAGDLLATFGSFGVLDTADVTRQMEAGAFTLVVSVRDYNGAPNDARVTLAVFVSNGLDGRGDAMAPAPPVFDGTDAWTVDPGSLLSGATSLGVDCGADARGCAPLYFDDNAYVAGNVLVGRLDFPVSLGGGAVGLDLTGSVVTARIVNRGNARALEDGQIAGRWSTSKLLASLAVLTDPLNGKAPLCGDNPTYQGIKRKICAAADIAVDPKRDSVDAPCDALSLALGFRAEPAKLGTVVQTPPPSVGCADGGVPFQDSCP